MLKKALCALALVFIATICRAQDVGTPQASPPLTELSLEQLMNIEVTSASKKEQKLSEVPAALYVITQEEIRRSGATSIPEALRLAPGLEVARINAHTWAITARGFNSLSANKLLVLIDGRSVYTPLFSGVWWDVQDLLLEDVDRIEVILGPGATIWGANAVNGVINIITKSAQETQGLLVAGIAGTEERGAGSIRYGSKIGEKAYFRAYAKYFDRDNSEALGGGDANDRWHQSRGGFRVDWDSSDRNRFSLQGDIYAGEENDLFTQFTLSPPYTQSVRADIDVSGGNLLGRWSRALSERSDMTLLFYYDRSSRDEILFRETRDTFDLDFHHRFRLGERQEIVWGLGYNLTRDRIGNTFTVSFSPDRRTDQVVSGFAQDEITWLDRRLHFTIGSKFERNDYTLFEIEPSARLAWIPSNRHTWWAAVSRAVRTPTRVENDIRINLVLPGSPPSVIAGVGNPDLKSEDLIAYEVGYRAQPQERLSFALSTFYNVYNNLLASRIGTSFSESSPAPTHSVLPVYPTNQMSGETYGGEIESNWQATDWWRLKGTYSFLEIQLHADPGTAGRPETAEGYSPHHQFSLRSSMNLPRRVEFDSAIRYVDRLPNLDVGSYLVLDLRLEWKPVPDLSLSVVGQNLLDSHHPEFTASSIVGQVTEVEQSVYTEVKWWF
jgi:iron complex outermembrane receptor protein